MMQGWTEPPAPASQQWVEIAAATGAVLDLVRNQDNPARAASAMLPLWR